MSNTLAGIVVLTRHGDRMGFYQSPKTYAASQTNLTVLGYRQQLANGQDLRARYLDPTTSTSRIDGIDSNIAENAQLQVLADAGGEGGVIVESALALLQGFYPPYNESLLLANGTTVDWSNRVQLIPVETVEPEQSVVLEPWTSCKSWTSRLNDWYASDDFKANADVAATFYKSISSLLGARAATLENAWNIYDFLNVEHIHNPTLSPLITDDILTQAGAWANYHETGGFTASNPKDIGNVAGQGMLSLLLDGIHSAANTMDPLKVTVLAASYKPTLSLFRMLEIPQLEANLIDYASTFVFEVYNDQTIQVLFRNGSTSDFQPYPILGTSGGGTIKVAEFEDRLRPYSIDTLAEWCDVCSTTDACGCDALYRLNGTGSGTDYAPVTLTYGHHAVSPVVAGLIGAIVTLALGAAVLAALAFPTGSRPVMTSKRNRSSTATAATRHGNFAWQSRTDSLAETLQGLEATKTSIELQTPVAEVHR